MEEKKKKKKKRKKTSKMTGCLKCCWFDLNTISLLKKDGTLSDPSLVDERLVLFQSNSCETSDGARLIGFWYSIAKQVCSLFFKTCRRHIPKHT